MRIEGHGALEFFERRRHIAGIPVGAPEKHMQRAAVARGLFHPLEYLDGAEFVIRLTRAQQIDGKRVKILNARLRIRQTCQRARCACVIPFLYEGAPQHMAGADTVWVRCEGLLGLLDRIVKMTGLEFCDCEVDPCVGVFFKAE